MSGRIIPKYESGTPYARLVTYMTDEASVVLRHWKSVDQSSYTKETHSAIQAYALIRNRLSQGRLLIGHTIGFLEEDFSITYPASKSRAINLTDNQLSINVTDVCAQTIQSLAEQDDADISGAVDAAILTYGALRRLSAHSLGLYFVEVGAEYPTEELRIIFPHHSH